MCTPDRGGMLLFIARTPRGPKRVRSLQSPVDRTSRTAWAKIMLITAVIAAAAYWWSEEDESAAIRRLPEAQRAGLYQRTLQNLTTICEPAPGRSVRSFCRAEATFALQFRECDDACRQLARRQLSLPRP